METIQSWAVTVVICILVAAVIQLFFPNMEKDKSIRVLVSAFMLSALLSPFLSGAGVDLKLPETDAANAQEQLEEISGQINRSLETQAKRRLEEAAGEVLAQSGITDAEITVETDILEAGHIQIEEIVLISSRSADWEGIEEELEEKTGCPVRVEYEVNG